MTREEFIETLEISLQGQVPPEVAASNLRYYRSYISEETAKGRSEEEILDMLGDPRLIARTIVDAATAQGGQRGANSRGENWGQQEQTGTWTSNKNFLSGSWKWVLILVLVVIFVITLVSGMISLLIRIALSPVFWALVLICVCGRIFFHRR
ncbi:DUF1700 domain-containing protein [Hominifimenecus sp. rT4P-3]|uniref:DUF1700 domain-containing protein n=1 Tax=Hominifimenecus sp. rT4P-3 TaxID=3242979 RepID=UPI003DA6611F